MIAHGESRPVVIARLMADETQINVVVAAVDLVANERMADVRQMDADLMLAPGRGRDVE